MGMKEKENGNLCLTTSGLQDIANEWIIHNAFIVYNKDENENDVHHFLNCLPCLGV